VGESPPPLPSRRGRSPSRALEARGGLSLVEEERGRLSTLDQADPSPSEEPVSLDRPPAPEELVDDLEARLRLGVERYGRRLSLRNGRDAVVDAYQEALDLCLYLRQAHQEGELDVADALASIQGADRVALVLRRVLDRRARGV